MQRKMYSIKSQHKQEIHQLEKQIQSFELLNQSL